MAKKIEKIEDITACEEGWVTFTPNGNPLLINDKTILYLLMDKLNELVSAFNALEEKGK